MPALGTADIQPGATTGTKFAVDRVIPVALPAPHLGLAWFELHSTGFVEVGRTDTNRIGRPEAVTD